MNLLDRETELSSIVQGFSSTGNMRAALIIGELGMGKSTLLEFVSDELLKRERGYYWLCPKSSHLLSPSGWASQLARDLQAGDDVARSKLVGFASETGKNFATLPHSTLDLDPEKRKEVYKDVSSVLVKNLVELVASDSPDRNAPVFVLDDLDQYSDDLLDWLADDFNHALRESKGFTKARFLFSATTLSPRLSTFFEKFGIEKVHQFPLLGLSPNQSKILFQTESKQPMSAEEIHQKTKGNPSKILNLAAKRIIVENNRIEKSAEKNQIKMNSKTEFNEKQWQYLYRAAYPDRVNRYTLEFFTDPREAAFCYNWLKRSPKLATVQTDGDLILDSEFRKEVQKKHSELNPEEAENWEAFAFVLNAFMSIFPNPDSHWIPVNLQLFHCFNKKLLRKLFNESSLEEIIQFLEDYEHLFVTSDQQYKLDDDAKLIASRFAEIAGLQPQEGLVEKIKIAWEEDQEVAEQKRSVMEEERRNLLKEEEDSQKQIKSLGELKVQLFENFKKPTNFKPQRIYSVGNAPILVIIGICTIGVSLFSESVGSYYAATGIFLTILGFFWPSVEVKKPAMSSAGNGPNLAIETQQRSLDHRIAGLKNRISSMNGSIQRLTSELDEINSGVKEPYLVEN